jgi:hypothetical protein
MPMRILLAPLALGIALVSVALAADADAEGGQVIVRQEMQQGINDATMEIWDVGNNAMGNQGGIDPKLMDEASWTKLGTAAGRLAADAQKMADAKTILAADPAESKDVEPGSFSIEDVQGYIDGDPAAFRAFAAALAVHAEKLSTAAKDKDAAAAGPLVDQLDSVCEACHAKYWYPQG